MISYDAGRDEFPSRVMGAHKGRKMGKFRIVLVTEDTSKETAMQRITTAAFRSGISMEEIRIEEVKGKSPNASTRPLKVWAQKLRNNPRNWEVLEECSEGSERRGANLSYNIKHGKLLPFSPAGLFDSYTSKDETGITRVWAVYLGADHARSKLREGEIQ